MHTPHYAVSADSAYSSIFHDKSCLFVFIFRYAQRYAQHILKIKSWIESNLSRDLGRYFVSWNASENSLL